MSRRPTPPLDRFFRYVDKQQDGSSCWLWTGGLTRGYGRFRADRTVIAHRWLYQQVVEELSDDTQLDHLCRNTACVNPEHLEPVTALINISRATDHNGSKVACPKGHPYDDANTVHCAGRRACRECRNAWQRDYYRARKAAEPAA